MKRYRRIQLLLSALLAFACLWGCGTHEQPPAAPAQTQQTESIPEYEGEPYVELNGNEPQLPQWDGSASFESYSELDELGRCQGALASIGQIIKCRILNTARVPYSFAEFFFGI